MIGAWGLLEVALAWLDLVHRLRIRKSFMLWRFGVIATKEARMCAAGVLEYELSWIRFCVIVKVFLWQSVRLLASRVWWSPLVKDFGLVCVSNCMLLSMTQTDLEHTGVLYCTSSTKQETRSFVTLVDSADAAYKRSFYRICATKSSIQRLQAGKDPPVPTTINIIPPVGRVSDPTKTPHHINPVKCKIQ